MFLELFGAICELLFSGTKTLDGSTFPKRPALDQLNSIEKTSFRPAQLIQIDQPWAS